MTIGQRLREARERLGLTLDEAERTTRIRAVHLEALERDDFEALPSPVQARGFLRNYAAFLGLDPEPLLQEQNGTPTGRRPSASRVPGTRPIIRARPRRLSGDMVVAGAIALGTLGLLVWGGGRAMASLRSAAAPPEESSAFLISTPTPSPAPVATSAEALPAEIPPTASATLPLINLPPGQVSVRLLIVQRAWVRGVADGIERYRGRVEPGAIIDLLGERIVEVTTGNGAGVKLSVNGQDLGVMGGLDEAVTRLWTVAGEVTPTPTITPTPTATLRPTATPLGGGGG